MSLSVRQQCMTGVVALVLGFAAIAPAAAQAKGLDLNFGGKSISRLSDTAGQKSKGKQTDAGQQSDTGKPTDFQAQDDRGSDADRRSDRLERLARPGDLRILDALGRTIKVVSRGHDVVIDQPDNTYTHYWIGNNGLTYMVVRDNNNGWSAGFVMVAGVWQPVPPPPPKPKKRSFISLYDPETNKTYTRIWPAGGGVINVEEDGDTRANYDHK